MQVYPNQLQKHLQAQLPNLFLVFGDEPLQKLECIDAVRQAAKTQGADERIVLTVDNSFDWHQLLEEFQAMSLFSAKKIIELELPTAKPGKDGASMLEQVIQLSNPDIFLVIHGPKLEQAQQKTKWFKTLDKVGLFIPCFPVEGQQLQRWLQQRINQQQLNIEADALLALTDYCEGNLLAASQEVEKLSLLFSGKTISLNDVQQTVVNHSRFNVFQLVDLLLVGDQSKAMQILERLESEGLEPTIVLWALQREVFTLIELQTAQANGEHLAGQWNKHRIWKSRQAGYQQALSRISQAQLEHMVGQLSELDKQLKSFGLLKPYIKLAHICLLFTHASALSAYSV